MNPLHQSSSFNIVTLSCHMKCYTEGCNTKYGISAVYDQSSVHSTYLNKPATSVTTCRLHTQPALSVASVASLRAMHTIVKGKTYTIQFCYKLQCHAETEHELHNHFTPDRCTT